MNVLTSFSLVILLFSNISIPGRKENINIRSGAAVVLILYRVITMKDVFYHAHLFRSVAHKIHAFASSLLLGDKVTPN